MVMISFIIFYFSKATDQLGNQGDIISPLAFAPSRQGANSLGITCLFFFFFFFIHYQIDVYLFFSFFLFSFVSFTIKLTNIFFFFFHYQIIRTKPMTIHYDL
jgi:hypothetical protein